MASCSFSFFSSHLACCCQAPSALLIFDFCRAQGALVIKEISVDRFLNGSFWANKSAPNDDINITAGPQCEI